MTRAVVATAFGGPEVLSVVDVEVPAPGPGQVVVDVRAAALNPADWKAMAGAFGADESRLPLRVGMEGAGVVVAVGPDADGPAGPVAVGDEVVVHPASGTFAERVVVPASSVLPKPPGVAWEPAAGALLVGVTAVHTLEATGVGPGETVLVHGAAGGVGRLVVQLAVARGARVVATASPARHDDLRSLGAVPVAYGEGLLDRVREAAPDGVDAAVDTAGTDEALDVSLALVSDRRRVATIANFGRAPGEGVQVLGNGPGADPGTQVRAAARLTVLAELAAGRVGVPVAATYPLEDVRSAVEHSLGGHAAGKIVLLP